MTTVAVILSGCGALDGSEVAESILTLLALDRAGLRYRCLAPNIPQTRVMNTLTQQEISQAQRNVLEESARIARGKITDLAQAKAHDYAAMIFPGGYGAAINLCDFASKGARCHVQKDVLNFATAMIHEKKPAGFICIAPVLAAKLYPSPIRLTIGHDVETAEKLEKMGAIHVPCQVDSFVVDAQHHVVSTPAYMLARSIKEVATGIEGLVDQIAAWIHA